MQVGGSKSGEFVREIARRVAENSATENPRVAEIEAERRQRAAQDLLDRQRRLRGASGVSARFAEASLTKAEITDGNSDAVHAAAHVVEKEFRESLAFYGSDVGDGKTYLASAIVNAAIEKCVPAKLLRSVSIFEAMHKASKFGSDEDVPEILEELASVRVLVLDDLGRESLTKRTIPWLYELLDRRWNECKPLIVTTNFSFEQLHDHYASACVAASLSDTMADGMVDRVRGMVPLDRWVKVTGRSQRGRA